MIELVITSAMVGLLGLAIFAAFNNGVRIYQRVSRPQAQEDLAVFLSKFTADVRNCVVYGRLSGVYTSEHLELVTQVASPRLGSSGIGKVIYAYDPVSGALSRQVFDMSGLYVQGGGPAPVQSIGGVGTLSFSYLVFNEEKRDYVWQDSYANAAPPHAIRLQFDFGTGKDAATVTRTVSVPIGA